MMAILMVEITRRTAAFGESEHQEAAALQTALTNLAHEIAVGRGASSGPVKDVNGAEIGRYEFGPDAVRRKS